jgi:integrase
VPSTRKRETKSGQLFYEIRVSRGREKSYLTRRWYPPEGWSQKAIERELATVAAEFERQCDAGEVITRAEQREREAEAEREAAKILTLRQYGERVFMPAKSVTMSENARSSYQSNLDRWIYPALGDVKLPEIAPAQLSALLLSMQAQGKAHGTALKVYTVLQGLFKMAYRSDTIPVNPMDKVDRPKPRKDEQLKAEEEKAYTAQELHHILQCLNEEPLKWRCYVSLVADTGVRRGEACGIQWTDIDFKAGTVTFRHNLQYTPAAGVYDTSTKGKRARTVDVGPHVLDLLQQLRDAQSKSAVSKWVFTKEGSPEPMHPQTPTEYFHSFGQRYGIEDFHPHKLRHTSASVALTNGADLVSVSERLGHKDPATTARIYAHANQESIRRAGQIAREAIEKAGQG